MLSLLFINKYLLILFIYFPIFILGKYENQIILKKNNNEIISEYKKNNGFYIISHMVNHNDLIDWSLEQGANAIEADLQFNNEGIPIMFQHSESFIQPCDCTFGLNFRSKSNICTKMSKMFPVLTSQTLCFINTPIKKYFEKISTKNKLALFIIDSKLDKLKNNKEYMKKAGKLLIKQIVEYIFPGNYNGKIVIGISKKDFLPYLESAIDEVKEQYKQYESRIYFSIDQEEFKDVIQDLVSLNTNRRIYGTGISSLVPGDFSDSIKTAYYNKINYKNIGISYIWTIDKDSSMEKYINLGVDGIITNTPKDLYNIIRKLNIKLAEPQNDIQVSISKDYFSGKIECDCKYVPKGFLKKSGCIIIKSPPPNLSCKCFYRGAWSCGGYIVECSNKDSYYCKNPDNSKNTCLLGGGDCLGY